LLSANECSEPIVGIIKYVVINNAKYFYIIYLFIYELCENIGLNSHKYTYEISFGLTTNVRTIWFNFDKLFVTRNINYIATD